LVYRLSEENRKQMESENPELATEFHRLIIIMIERHPGQLCAFDEDFIPSKA
jgi:hypothetical protein